MGERASEKLSSAISVKSFFLFLIQWRNSHAQKSAESSRGSRGFMLKALDLRRSREVEILLSLMMKALE